NCLGIPLYFSGRNDILLKGKKISGNAFWKNKNPKSLKIPVLLPWLGFLKFKHKITLKYTIHAQN
ncbi:MAG: hypothetical protein Q8835_02490, partial [Sweet potato little leaf phytoplasma]|nr:hypothetical protein [Sweet potato little leaf phytoplasma]